MQAEVIEDIQRANPTVFIIPIYEGQQNPSIQRHLTGQVFPMKWSG